MRREVAMPEPLDGDAVKKVKKRYRSKVPVGTSTRGGLTPKHAVATRSSATPRLSVAPKLSQPSTEFNIYQYLAKLGHPAASAIPQESIDEFIALIIDNYSSKGGGDAGPFLTDAEREKIRKIGLDWQTYTPLIDSVGSVFKTDFGLPEDTIRDYLKIKAVEEGQFMRFDLYADSFIWGILHLGKLCDLGDYTLDTRLSEENDELKSQLEELRSARDQTGELDSRLEKLTEDYNEAVKGKNQAEDQSKKLEEKVAGLEERVQTLTKDYQLVVNEKEGLEKDVQKLGTQLASAIADGDKSRKLSEQDFTRLKRDLEIKYQDKLTEKDSFNEEKRNDLKAYYEGEIARINEEHEEELARVSDLSKEEREKLKESLTGTYSGELEELKEKHKFEIAQKDGLIANLSEEANSYKMQLEDMTQTMSVATDRFEEDRAGLVTDKKSVEKQYADLYSKFTTVVNQLADTKEVIKKLQLQFNTYRAKSEKDLETLATRNETILNDYAALKESYDELIGGKTDLSEKLSGVKLERDKLARQLDTATKQLERTKKLKDDYQEADARINEYEDLLSEKQDELELKEEELSKYRISLAKLEEDFKARELQNDSLKSKNNSLTDEIAKHTATIDRLTHEVKNAEVKVERLKSDLEVSMNHYDETKELYETAIAEEPTADWEGV